MILFNHTSWPASSLSITLLLLASCGNEELFPQGDDGGQGGAGGGADGGAGGGGSGAGGFEPGSCAVPDLSAPGSTCFCCENPQIFTDQVCTSCVVDRGTVGAWCQAHQNEPNETPRVCGGATPEGSHPSPYVCRLAEPCTDPDNCGAGPRIYCTPP